jgi:hypothetical protein
MRRCFGLFVLTALAAALSSASTLRAQEPSQAEGFRTYAGPPNLYAATAPEQDLFEALQLGATGPEVKRWHPLGNWYRKSCLYCATHHDSAGCGSTEAEYVFLFGGCRQFYGEPCFKGPNPYPHSAWPKHGSCPNCQ